MIYKRYIIVGTRCCLQQELADPHLSCNHLHDISYQRGHLSRKNSVTIMDRLDRNGRTRQENERKVNKFLNTTVWIGSRRSSIRREGRNAIDQRERSGYNMLIAILDTLDNTELDFFQQKMVFNELGWIFKCKQCNVGQAASEFISTNRFQIHVNDTEIIFESVGPCKDCMRH
jgi:hypothetical protein